MRFPTKVITLDEEFRFEVSFDPVDREDGWDDDIRLTMHESRRGDIRLLAADSTSILLTADQAEALANALLAAAKASCNTPR